MMLDNVLEIRAEDHQTLAAWLTVALSMAALNVARDVFAPN